MEQSVISISTVMQRHCCTQDCHTEQSGKVCLKVAYRKQHRIRSSCAEINIKIATHISTLPIAVLVTVRT